MSKQAERVVQRFHKTARSQAEYWFEPLKVKNLTVKNYESPDRGNSARNGDFMMSGKLHIQPKGATWDVQLPVNGQWTLNEHDQSGTLAFSAKDRTPEAQLAGMALDYDTEDQIMRLLGDVEFVSYEEPTHRKPGDWQQAARILYKYQADPTAERGGDMSDWAINTLRERYSRGEMAKMFREETSNARGLKPTVDGLKKFLNKSSDTDDELARAAIFLQFIAKGVVS